MTAVWQMVDSILIPILIYACEAWTPNKEEITKLQTIFNEALKTILSLPKGTPTTILLNETGNYPIELTTKKKKILHAKRIDSLKGEALIKDATSPKNSEWRKEIDRIAEEFNVKDQMTVLTKTSLKKHLHEEIKTKFMDHIENEYVEKTKIKHWKDLKTDITSGKRPLYMEKLNRKECSAIIRTRASMLPVKNNFKKGCKNDLLCRFCKKETETQEHILQTCPEIRERCGQTIEYKEIFQENVEELKKAANFIIKTTEELSKAEEYKKKWRQRSRTAWAPPMGVSHPADPGKCKTTTTTSVMSTHHLPNMVCNRCGRDKMSIILQTTFSNRCDLIQILLKSVPINTIWALVQVMAWHQTGYKPLP